MAPSWLDSYRLGASSFIHPPPRSPYYYASPRFHNPCVRTCLFVSAQTVISLPRDTTSTNRHLQSSLRPRLLRLDWVSSGWQWRLPSLENCLLALPEVVSPLRPGGSEAAPFVLQGGLPQEAPTQHFLLGSAFSSVQPSPLLCTLSLHPGSSRLGHGTASQPAFLLP